MKKVLDIGIVKRYIYTTGTRTEDNPMPITQMLKEAREAGQTTVVVSDGVFGLYWVDGRGTTARERVNNQRQIWLFIPR